MVAERMRCAIMASMIGVVLEIELGRCEVYIRVRWGQVESLEGPLQLSLHKRG